MQNKRMTIVVRVEFATMTNSAGELDMQKMERFIMVVSSLQNYGANVIIVSSGAIMMGARKLGMKGEPDNHIAMQAAAAIGQAELIKMYQLYFDEYSQIVAQILLTNQIMDNPVRVKNAHNTFSRLLEMNIIPIVNENDTVSTQDIELNDNYPLTLNVAKLVDADVMLLKSSESGKYLFIATDNAVKRQMVEEKFLTSLLDEAARVFESGKDYIQRFQFPETGIFPELFTQTINK